MELTFQSGLSQRVWRVALGHTAERVYYYRSPPLLLTTDCWPYVAKFKSFPREARSRNFTVISLNIGSSYFKSPWRLNKTCLQPESGFWSLPNTFLTLLVCLRRKMQWNVSCSHVSSLLWKQWTHCQRFGNARI